MNKTSDIGLKTCGSKAIVPEEPIIVSAPIARRVAPGLCHVDPATGEDCAWYHGVWQYLRILDLVPTPARHAEFFLDALRSLARAGAYRRVLVSGTADYSMLAHVLWAYQAENAPAEVTVVDICETPLYLSRWYAEKVGAAIHTDACNILDHNRAEPYDVICTHSFLRRFTPSRRPRVIAKWRDLLRPGGKVVTAGRVGARHANKGVGVRQGQVAEVLELILREAEKWRELLDIDPQRLMDMARLYVERPAGHPRAQREEYVDLFINGGFTIDRLDFVRSTWISTQRAPGLEVPESVEYGHVIATRK